VDPRPNAPDQWDINLGKIAYMGQYLGDTISPYEMLAQMFGEPENLTKLQAMAKQWETFEKDPGIGGIMRSVIGSLSALVSTEGLEKTNKPNPLYLIEGYVKAIGGFDIFLGDILDYVGSAWYVGWSHVPGINKLISNDMNEFAHRKFAEGNAAMKDFAGLGTPLAA